MPWFSSTLSHSRSVLASGNRGKRRWPCATGIGGRAVRGSLRFALLVPPFSYLALNELRALRLATDARSADGPLAPTGLDHPVTNVSSSVRESFCQRTGLPDQPANVPPDESPPGKCRTPGGPVAAQQKPATIAAGFCRLNCPGLDSNQHGVLTPPGPQPDASANSATRAPEPCMMPNSTARVNLAQTTFHQNGQGLYDQLALAGRPC